MSLLEKANKKAEEKGIKGEIQLSPRDNKKLMLITPRGKKIHFGAKNSTTFLEGASEEKRKNYRARHSKIKLNDGRKAYRVKNTPSYLSWHILW